MKAKLLILVLLVCIKQVNAQICFSPKVAYPVGINSSSLCYADFNGDTIIDLAVANKTGSTSILLGDGIGGFGTASHFATGYLPVSICSADLNGDSIADLATSNAGPWSISMLPGNGNGSFGNDTTIGAGSNPHSITSADFNGDGNADLAEATQYTVIMLIGDGAGNFTDTTFATGHSYASIISADFNGDTIPDLAMAGGGNNVTVLIGNGSGGFGNAATFPVDTSPQSIISADFNHDGKIDLATGNMKNYTTGNVSVLLGSGTGSFGAVTNFPIGIKTVPYSLCSADFDGDSIVDLAIAAIANNSTPNVSVLQGNGTGGFGSAVVFAVDSFPNSVVSADFNKDGKMDLAVVTLRSNIDSGKVDVLLNCSITGVSELNTRDKQIMLYPNPCNGIFTLEMNGIERAGGEMEIYNVLGEKIYHSTIQEGSNSTIDISDRANGIYFVKFCDGEKYYTNKVLIP